MKLNDLIKEENENWSEIFIKEMNKKKNKNYRWKKFSSYWWKEYYGEIKSYVYHLLIPKKNPKILEAGCGSGKASLLLGKNLNRVLLDISEQALIYSKLLTKEYGCKNVTHCLGNIFNLKFKKNDFDLVWNIGVVEHYEEREIVNILKEMIRVTKKGGVVAFGVPNEKSGPIIKAKLLSNSLFKFFDGYRIGSEKFYSIKKLKYLFKKAFDELGENYENMEVNYFGNILTMESPKWLIKTFGKVLSQRFKEHKFLIMMSVNKI